MTIKELFEKVESLNKTFSELEYPMQALISMFEEGTFETNETSNYEIFLKQLKREFNSNYLEEVLKADFEKISEANLYKAVINGYETFMELSIC